MRVFIAQKYELGERWDPMMVAYRRNLSHFKYQPVSLASLLISPPQYGANESGIKRISEQQVRYIRITDINDNGLLNNNLGATVERINAKYILNHNDLLFARSGATVGKTFLYKKNLYNYPCLFAGYLIKFQLNPSIVIPDYLFIYTQLSSYKDWIIATQRAAAQPNINAEEYKSLQVPLPPLTVQNKIYEIYHFAVLNKQKKEQEAKDLLDSINDYLLSALGIERPERTENGRFFYTSFHNIMGEELAPLSVKNKGKQSKSTLYKETKLSTIATIEKGQAITSKDIISGNYPVIAGGQSSPYNHNQYNYKGNVVTVSASGAYSGYVWYHDYPIFASDCSVIYSKDEKVYLTKYIYEILHLRQQEIYLLQKGAGQPHVYASDLAQMTIPIVPFEKQREIISHCNKLRATAEKLKQEGMNLVESARKAIETMILGE